MNEDSIGMTKPLITLYPYQEKHVKRLKRILEKSPFALDLSMLGTGKTYTTTRIASDLAIGNIIVIAPAAIKSKWNALQHTYETPPIECLSFCELRSSKCKQPRHGLLNRRDYKRTVTMQSEQRIVDCCDFTPTAKLKQLVQDGVLLVIDEIQNIKNLTSQFHACRALINAVMQPHATEPMGGIKSRVLLLSGSPIDKEVHAVHLLKGLGIMTSEKLADYSVYHGTYDYPGLSEIVQFCQRLDPKNPLLADYEIILHQNLDNYCCVDYVYLLFQGIIKKRLSREMPRAALPKGVDITKRNGFFNIHRLGDRELLGAGVQGLSKASSYNALEHTVNFGTDAAATMSAIQSALIKIETAKIETFVRLARKHLDDRPTSKVIICVNYRATVTDLMRELNDLNPCALEGRMPSKQREISHRKFQSPTLENRLLISNLTVCSTGIDLDDKVGSFPRIMLVSPMFNTITLYQLCHRLMRMDTKSCSEVFMVYGKNTKQHPCITENRIIDALSKKSTVMKETTNKQFAMGVVFPGDYEDWTEDDPDPAVYEEDLALADVTLENTTSTKTNENNDNNKNEGDC